MSELKSCPFCGGNDIKIGKHIVSKQMYRTTPEWSPTGEIWSMCCCLCGATFPNRYKKELLVKAWNRRK